MTPTVVGLDIATRTGWCRVNGRCVTTGVLDCAPRSGDEPEGARYRRLADRIPAVVDGADAVILEQPFSRGRRTVAVLAGLTAVVLVHLEGRRMPYAFVTASELKAFGRAHGSVGKAAMQAAASAELGRDLTDDEADAYWLCRYWAERLAP